MSDIKSKGGAPIEQGDTVSTPYRGGKHEGKVEQIVTSEEQAGQLEDAKGAGHAPAVIFTDQNNKKVAHKPTTLTNLDRED